MIDFTNWKYYKDVETNENIGITIITNNVQESRLLTDTEVAKWLAEGNIPQEAE
jgi:hypothetical protein